MICAVPYAALNWCKLVRDALSLASACCSLGSAAQPEWLWGAPFLECSSAHVCQAFIACAAAKSERLKQAKREAEKEIQAYRQEREEAYKKRMADVSGAIHRPCCCRLHAVVTLPGHGVLGLPAVKAYCHCARLLCCV